VDEKVADDFVAKFAFKTQSLPAGNPRNGNIVLGPMIGVESAERVEGLVKDAVAKGAKLAAAGHREGTIMAATVLDFVTPEMRIYREESFGRSPLLFV
jgi:acyl-CoA reductase-like NAD-dependent aldehyde dehydrogenase